MFSCRGRRLVYAGVATSALVPGLLGASASAAPQIISSLVSTPASVTLDLANPIAHPNPQSVSVQLDPATCVNPLVNGMTYGISLKTGYDASVVGVSGGGGSFQCGSNPAAASFTLTGAACGSTTVGFHPVVSNKPGHDPNGVQDKLGDGSVAVTVIDSAHPDLPNCAGSVVNPPTLGNPAAPAVANAYLDASGAAMAKTCKQYIGSNNWRGIVISAIAAWMPRPESLKDVDFPLPDQRTWNDYVTAQVDYYCGTSATPVSPAPTSLPGAHA
jgi:hypothetical protein